MSALRHFWDNVVGPTGSTRGSGGDADSPSPANATRSDDQFLTAAGEQTAGSGKAPDQTDDTQLRAVGTVFVSPDGGTTDEPFPKPDVEYDFCASVVNAGKLPSGPFSVLFQLSEDMDWKMSLAQDAGLKAGASMLAVVHFGKFPNKFASYYLTADVYADSAPDKSISSAGSFEITINTV